MLKIKHAGVEGTAEVPEKVLPHYLAGGWELADGEKPRKRTTLILARVKAVAAKYAREAGLAENEWVYASDLDAVRGLTADSVDVVEVPGYTEHRHHDEIAGALAAAGILLSPAPAAAGDDSTGGRAVPTHTDH